MKLCGIISTWVIAIGIAIPYIITLDYKRYGSDAFCLEDPSVLEQTQKDIYVVCFVFFGWILPIILVTMLYGLCIRKLIESSFTNDSNDSMQRRVMQNKKVIKMFIIIGSIYCICTMPYAVLYACINFFLAYRRDEVDIELIWTLNYSLFALTNFNSCINPLVYARRHPDVKAFAKLAWNKLCCKALNLRKRSINTRKQKYSVSTEGERNTEMSNATQMTVRRGATDSISFQNKAFTDSYRNYTM